MANFRSGSYRSCVLMLSNAVFAYADQKLRHAASVDDQYQAAVKDVDDRKNGGDAFEARLASCLDGTDLVDEEKKKYLEELRTLRNRAAHPNGKNIRDSEAAFLLREGVKLFLSQLNLDPKITVEEITARVRAPDYFPRQDRNSILDIVRSEIELLPSAAYQRLVERIVKLMILEEAFIRNNAVEFLCACAELRNEHLDIALARKAILSNLKKDPAQHDVYILATVKIIDRSSGCLDHLKANERSRLDVKLAEFFRSFKNIHQELHSSEAAVINLTANKASNKDEFSDLRAVLKSSLALGFMLLGNPGVPDSVRQLINNNIRSAAQTWGSERTEMLSFFERVGEELIDCLTDQESYRLWVALEMRRAGGPRNKNITSVGSYHIDPSTMKFPNDEAVLARLETKLRERVQNAFRSHPSEMGGLARRLRLPLPPGVNESDRRLAGQRS